MPDLYDVNSYDYDLDPSRIAQYPLKERSQSKLMILNRDEKSIRHGQFYQIIDLLVPGDLLVLNNSKVFPARIYGYKENGTKIEFLLTRELEPLVWLAMLKPAKRVKLPQYIRFSENLRAFVEPSADGEFRQLSFECQGDFWEEIYRIGHVPLPPYISREDQHEDKGDYQTVFAKERGSIAAPTAGFHFTDQLLRQIREKGINICEIMLHVGIGTFLTVKTDRIDEHKMHSEYCVISPEVAEIYNKTRSSGNRVIAVGTTSLRSLESFFDGTKLRSGSMWTDIFLHPGKDIHSIDALVTNFHLPKSTLLMLVSAFAGYEFTRLAYREAINLDYRFFSYGDAMFIQ